MMNIPKLCSRLVLGTVLMLLSIPVMAGIAASKHNLSPSGTGATKVTAGTDEICVFCHTPHGADTTANPPLWNKRTTTGASYVTYSSTNSSTIDGSVLGVGSVSIACLSCHDGTQAMDNIINAPGSGGYDATGGGTNGLAYTWAAGGKTDAGGFGIMTNAAGELIPALGADLTDDHPIGIEYCGGGTDSTTPATGCDDKDFNATTALTASVWYVDVDSDTAREKTDIILYTRDFSGVGGSASWPSVECASCHDPHQDPGTADTFLRFANTGSAVCLACHAK